MPQTSASGTGAPVFVVMAVYRPDPDHLRAQMVSLAAQSHAPRRVLAVIADTVSGDLVTETAADIGLDLALVETGMELDAVRAFEAGIAEAVTRAEALAADGGPEPLIALCDQDDIWHPDRLARGVAALAEGLAQLVHSDARLVGPDGTTELQRSMFRFERRQRRPGLRGLLYRNNITGMTLLMRLRVAQLALPFPQQSGVHFYHDLWLGLIAAATGGVRLIDAPLVDYRQHGANTIGAVDRQGGWLRSGGGRRLPDAMWLRRESAAYGLARYLAQSLQNRMADAVADGRLAHGVARTAPLRPYLRRTRGMGTHLADAARLLLTGHAGLARIAAGFGVVSLGRTVWTLRNALSEGMASAIEAFDTRLYSLSPGVAPRLPQSHEDNGPRRKPKPWEDLADRRKTPRWTPAFSAPAPALTVLVPTLNPSEIFAGIVTALDIGLGLAARGLDVRFVATDLPVSSPGASRSFLLRRLGPGAAQAAPRVSLHCGVSETEIPAHPGDRFLATAWWTAHLADGLIRDHGFDQQRFLYLIQDFEPNFYAWGPEFADAMASYGFEFDPLFNTTLLRDYFAQQGFGFAGRDAPAFHPAIDIGRYAGQTRSAASPRRLALYGRPEVPRNMYATAIEALARFAETEKLGPGDIELVSIGLAHAPVALPGGLVLQSLGKLPWEEYPGYLAGTDLGLSLMFSPHPSHPPLEMAASGVRVVTNTFGPKDLGALSPAIDSVAPTAPELAEALSRAWRTAEPVSDAARRIDLTELGQPIETLIDDLACRLTPALKKVQT
ncbi:glycosyl transferase family 1 [Aestuariicoccus sp. MJ-SS9]|uniref:rhamnosyltransferase WsaF family glycosyltransferase n=1 Tax=Aestuariicoccus sp. MJ-SS9 TaxID=3079855 RepID=UPI00290957BF|nr:glycosyl transferase family 1 [Aestuariicoccus sp. MJ-SS9]MDU8912162.1 glycosyl transferase family 1 [Aestuariicoccus sp. MJ-SS9]